MYAQMQFDQKKCNLGSFNFKAPPPPRSLAAEQISAESV